MIIIQPQIPSSSQGSPGLQAEILSQEPSPAPSPPYKPNKKEEEPEVCSLCIFHYSFNKDWQTNRNIWCRDITIDTAGKILRMHILFSVCAGEPCRSVPSMLWLWCTERVQAYTCSNLWGTVDHNSSLSVSPHLAENRVHGGARPRHYRTHGRRVAAHRISWVYLIPVISFHNQWYVFVIMAEIQTKRQERKRRSTANPAYSLFDPEVALRLTCTTFLVHLKTKKKSFKGQTIFAKLS